MLVLIEIVTLPPDSRAQSMSLDPNTATSLYQRNVANQDYRGTLFDVTEKRKSQG